MHLQYLGHPIANDQVYSETRIWVCSHLCLLRVTETWLVKSQGENLGKGGVDVTPSDERFAPLPPSELPAGSDRLTRSDAVSQVNGGKPLPRETGHDIGMGSPVPLSKETVEIITRLRSLKVRGCPPPYLSYAKTLTNPFQDEGEDWSRWRDVIFKAKGVLAPKDIKIKTAPPQNRRRRGGPAVIEDSETSAVTTQAGLQLVNEEVVVGTSNPEAAKGTDEPLPPLDENGYQYCPECYLPLHPDPKPEKLYIFLHALRYTTSLGSFETEMPDWAAEGWEWNRD